MYVVPFHIISNADNQQIMMQYHYCSRDRRGLEYHMATRYVMVVHRPNDYLHFYGSAVKFIRDQANATHTVDKDHSNDRGHGNTAMMAASAIRKILKGENNTKTPKDFDFPNDQPGPTTFDPMDGWAEGVSLTKGHYCLLVKPQIVLRGESSTQACIVAASQAKIQSFDIMDLANFDDPISGKVMSRCVPYLLYISGSNSGIEIMRLFQASKPLLRQRFCRRPVMDLCLWKS